MLIQVSSSMSCRGWEENSSDLIETDEKTLKEYIIKEVLMDEWEYTREESIKELENKNGGFGGWELYGDEINYEGEESCVTYKVYVPTQEDVDMLLRNMK